MGSSNSSVLALATLNTTNNVDRRAALQDAVFVGDGSSANVTMYSADAAVLETLANAIPDSVKALMSGGATLLRDASAAIVDLNKDSIAANSKAWDQTLETGSAMVDRLIDSMAEGFGLAKASITAGNTLAAKAVDSFQPTDNKAADVGKYAVIAVAIVAAAVLWDRMK